MSEGEPDQGETRVLVVTPTAKDAELLRGMFERSELVVQHCSDLDEVCDRLDEGAGAMLLPEESLLSTARERLERWLKDQPAWSDMPLLIVARPGADSIAVAQAMDLLGNVTVLERPIRTVALISAVRAALRTRQRQYQLREQLKERERAQREQVLLASIVASSDDAIISKTLEGKILTWNAGAERLFGYSAEEVIGQPITVIIPPERRGEEPQLLERLRRGERLEHFETVRIAKDGRRIQISLTLSPLRQADGTIIGASKVARDITERKAAEAALRDADRRKDEFLAILAHELRNPLAPIRNSLHILRLSIPDDAHVNPVVEMMERQVNQMVRLVDDLLEIARITRGKIALRKETIHAADIIRRAVETSQPLIDMFHHELSLELCAEPLTLEGDLVRLTQVVSNLLNNAAKYTQAGGRIRLKLERQEDEVVIAVRDNGAGIPSEMLARVFDLFTQLDSPVKQAPDEQHAHGRQHAQGGLGIGLTLVKSLVEMHGGTVRAHSAGLDQGSEFVVRLPASVRSVTAEPGTADMQAPAHMPPLRVLVVDDNRDAAETLSMLLRFSKAEVRVCYEGAAALDLLDTFPADVVVLDIGMPGMDGYEVARQIRRRAAWKDITLIALTGWGQEEARRQSQLAGFDHHLIKPVELKALKTLLTSLERRPLAR